MRGVLARLSEASQDECAVLVRVLVRLCHRSSKDSACARRVCAALLWCDDAAVDLLKGALEVMEGLHTLPVDEIDVTRGASHCAAARASRQCDGAISGGRGAQRHCDGRSRV
jgi:hypothetical protein